MVSLSGVIIDEAADCEHVIVFGTPYRRCTETLSADINHTSWAKYVGHYGDPFNTHPDDVLKVELEDERLYIYEAHTPKLAQPLSEHRFLTMLGVVEFEMSASGKNDVVAVQVGHAARYFAQTRADAQAVPGSIG